jgi:prepilin-type N-terminal cleavage/methylation domain-containing protein
MRNRLTSVSKKSVVAFRLRSQRIGMRRFTRENGFTMLETLMVVALIGVIATIAIPQLSNSIAYFRLSGDARSTSNAVALAKMRAASNFSKTRLYVNTAGGWHRVERADASAIPLWTAETGVTYLSGSTNFNFGPVGTPPPNTQAAIGNAAPCKDNAGADIVGTACIVFNSRGIPIAADVPGTTYTPTGDSALYLTDGSSVYAVTVASTGMIRLWQTLPTATPSWNRQ